MNENGVKALRASPLLAVLSEETLKQYCAVFHVRQLQAGEYLYFDGDAANTLTFIRTGRIKVTQVSSEGGEMIIGFFGEGDFVGCCCLLDTAKLPCSAQAVEPTEVICIAREDFLRMMNEHPALAVRTAQEITRRLRLAHTKMKNLALDPVEKRVVAALLELSERFGADAKGGARVIPSRVTRLELAQMAGTTLESASRTMSKLKRAGLVRSSRNRTVLLSPPDLVRRLR
ncbi:MAG: Crp/Fnr family transcriptional regulator [Abditibacteriales bacterium]|nr:Crp/Fnr family transcriptional regulator [Abditibacteriales bacterium]MDW8368303.1 Crp/Fnr family transcriptional regulator [Abditibacteriales bacterium]